MYFIPTRTHKANDLLFESHIHSHLHRGEEDRTRSNTEAIKAVVSDCWSHPGFITLNRLKQQERDLLLSGDLPNYNESRNNGRALHTHTLARRSL